MIILVHGEMGQWMMLDNLEGVGLQGKVPGAVPSRDGQETQCYIMATAYLSGCESIFICKMEGGEITYILCSMLPQ